jgi:hypothetical protein
VRGSKNKHHRTCVGRRIDGEYNEEDYQCIEEEGDGENF